MIDLNDVDLSLARPAPERHPATRAEARAEEVGDAGARW